MMNEHIIRDWQRARVCGNDVDCAEVAVTANGDILLRSSKCPETSVCFDVDEWRTFCASVRAGQFDM